jgi:two-component system LytT family sensor kinase
LLHTEFSGAAILRASVRGVAVATIRAWWKRIPGFWQAQIVGWSLFTLIDLIDRQLTYHNLPISLYLTLLIAPCSLLLSTGMRAAYTSLSPSNELTAWTLAVIVLSSLLASSIVVSVLFTIHQISGWTMPEDGLTENIAFPLVHFFLAFAGWSLCYFWIHAEIAERNEHRRAMAAQAEALRAQLEELRLQLDPHFLFNALNGVSEEIPEHPSAALAMLRDLTAYLRHSLAGINQTVVTVEAEIEGLSAYLRVQQARFGARLRITFHVDQEAASCRIASFLLQPLVENAVKHGSRETGMDIGVDIRLSGHTLLVEIENNGILGSDDGSLRRRPAIGLQNVRRRLALHYPDRHKFALTQRDTSETGPHAGNRVVASLVLEGEPCSGS